MTIEIDSSQFDNTLKRLMNVSQRELPVIINNVTRDVLLRSAQFTPKADAAKILSIESKPWWPRYIAKHMPKPYTIKQARAYSQKLLAKRIRGIGLLKAGFIKAAKILGSPETLPRPLNQARTIVKQARENRNNADVNISTIVKKTPEIAEQIMNNSLKQAIDFKIKDMTDYIVRKLDEAGKNQ